MSRVVTAEKRGNMNFVNTFLSYFVLMILFVAVAGIGAAIGIYKRKKKNAEQEA